MNTRENVALVPQGQARLIQDADPFQPGELIRRTGATSLDSPTGASEPLGISFWSPPTLRNARRLIGFWDGAADNIQLWESRGDGVWSAFDSGVSLVHTLSQFQQGRAIYIPTAGSDSGTTFFVETMFIASAAAHDSGGSFPLSGLAYRHDITTTTDRASQTFDVRPRAMLWWQGRLWAGNSATTAHGLSWLGWSDVFDGSAGWTDSNQNILVEPNDNDEISALHPVRGSNNEIYIFKERSIHALSVFWDTDGFYTESVDTLDTTQSQLRPIAKGVGCVATRSIAEVTLPDGSADIFFLAHDGVRSIRRAEQDTAAGAGRPISDGIQDTVDRINFDNAHKATAVIHKNLYLLSVPVDGSTTNNLVLAFDLINGGWYTYTWGAVDWVDMALTSVQKEAYFQTVGEFANDSAITGHHLYQGFTGTVDPGGSAIPFELQSRGYTFGDKLTMKQWDFIELQALYTGTDVSLTISAKVDEGEWENVGTISFSPLGSSWPTLPFSLPWAGSATRSQIKAIGMSLDPGHVLEVRVEDKLSFATGGLRTLTVGSRPFPRQFYLS
jgi:hypothetical protein